MALHYIFWVPFLWNNGTVDSIYGTIPPPILLVVFPLAGFAWLLYLTAIPRGGDAVCSGEKPQNRGWVLAGFAISSAVLGALWLPGRGYSLAHAKNPRSATVAMWRSNCQIGCPVYSLTICGNGTVDYVGEEFVRVRGQEHASIGEAEFDGLLDDFDRANFFALEDRAFAWGYHSSRVGVKITIDGKSKEVWSDTYDIGSRSGAQAKFVEAAAEVDKVVGTERWVKCGDSRCR